MRAAKVISLLCAVEAFVPRAELKRGIVARVSYLSEVEEGGKEKREGEQPSDPRQHSGMGSADTNAGPTSYDGFVDVEGFDGGDGQVGVVGDGKNAMEIFDDTETVAGKLSTQRLSSSVGGAESKATQKVAWGATTGYADKLRDEGMTDIDEFGEDRLYARRQQLENFRNQAEVRQKKEFAVRDLAALQGKKYEPARHGSYLAQFEAKEGLETDYYTGTTREGSPVVAAGGLVASAEIDGTYELTARLDSRDGVTVKVDNMYSTYSDFVAGVTADTPACFTVEPAAGTFNRRGGEPVEFVIKFQPTTFLDSYEGKVVIESEDYTWTYLVTGRLN